MEQVRIKTETILKHPRHRTNLELLAITSNNRLRPRSDSLIIWFHEARYYAILWMKTKDRILMSDSENSIVRGDKRIKIERLLEHKIEPYRITNKLKSGCCGAIAISSIIEFNRMYKSNNFGDGTITLVRSYLERAIASLHPGRNAPQQGRVDIRSISRTHNCTKCNFRTTKGRGGLLRHQTLMRHL